MNIRNKGKPKEESFSEEDKNAKKEERFDLKMPFDIKAFWKNINEKYFREIDEFDLNEANHLNDQIYTKIGFPRTVNCLIGKAHDYVSRKQNPLQISKFFGMYVYLDKFDYVLNNLHSEEIEDEVNTLQEKIDKIEESNLSFFKHLQNVITNDKIIHNQSQLINSKQVFQNRFDNLSNQIYTLQMKQFAESIWNIKKDLKKNKYVLIFDQSENIESLTLDEWDYKDLIKYRDPMNSVSVYDLFQEKIHSYYNTTTSAGNSNNTNSLALSNSNNFPQKKRRGRKPKNKTNLSFKADKRVTLPKKRGRKKKILPSSRMSTNSTTTLSKTAKKERVEIAKVVNINYEFCHHCKQRKPAEMMKKCNSFAHCKNVEKPVKTFYINNTTCVKKFKNFIITNFSGDYRDILDGYLNKKYSHECKRSFCSYCLKGSYDQVLEQIKDNKDWSCPWCLGMCFCSRCIRYDQILKLISLYVSHSGDLNILYDNLVSKSVVLDKLSINLLLSNIIIIKNDPVNKANKLIKGYTGKNDYEAIDCIIDQTYKFKDCYLNFKDYFNRFFIKGKHEKILLNMDKRLTEVNLKNNENRKALMLGKKKSREYADYDEDALDNCKSSSKGDLKKKDYLSDEEDEDDLGCDKLGNAIKNEHPQLSAKCDFRTRKGFKLKRNSFIHFKKPQSYIRLKKSII